MDDKEAFWWLNNRKIPRYRVKFRRRSNKLKAAEPSCKDQNTLEIKESLALEAAEVAKDDHDTAFMDVMTGGKTSFPDGGDDTEHANVGGSCSDTCTVVSTSKMEWLKKCDGNTKGPSYP
ncbi:PREDICTED: uncharacterized protein LOC104776645 [Camelina sativa]|uniref:Uncharacterized protein LOC104776645 n=1 Tax=Camelina sativa TaxID=90675 RepID=A0ABM0YCR8_CAMSA|nr:PREDICTED: uncharacterized protein LOC104776645 [Camelina sativa]